MHSRKHLVFNLLTVTAMMLSVFGVMPAGASVSTASTSPAAVAPSNPVQPDKPSPATAKAAPQAQTKDGPTVSYDEAVKKLDANLRELVQSPDHTLPAGLTKATVGNAIIVQVLAKAGSGTQAALNRYFTKIVAMPTSEKLQSNGMPQLYVGLIEPQSVLKVAFLPEVQSITAAAPERMNYDPYPADDTATKPAPRDWATLRANADKLRAGSLPWDQAKAFGDGREGVAPNDWFDMSMAGPTNAAAAWARGFRGEGVAVSVIDDGVDFAHPDLMGTQKIYSSTEASQYNGWPMVMDAFAMRALFYDTLFGTTYVSGGFPGVTYMDTSATPGLTPAGSGISTFKFTPLIDFNMLGFQHTYVISNSMTKSGVVHVGTHTDESLRDYVWGEKVAVLVTDPHVAGVYDTVYVDLNDDYDFRDEKPLTKADVNNPATYNNMVAYRDMNGDGKADLSGGLLYFIADGVNCVPAMDWLFGCGAPVGLIDPPGNGDLIAMHGPWDSGYSHGTQCASNVVAQGNINGLLPSFRDLPGNGQPAAAVYGAAPNADLVPMNTAWSFTGRITYNDAYFLAAIGYDAIDQTGFNFFYGPGYDDTDTILATSNSYGWSGDDNDGWDFLGQLIEELQRHWAPYLQFLFSTGNGGPGYGTVTPPSPLMGIGVGASTEYGSTGWDTITDTNQINFNDYVAFSNGGPGARRGTGTDVLAGGAFAAGAEELNYYAISTHGVLNGNISWSTWGGTSRSSPVALGVLALVYQAYKAAHGVWPTSQEAKAILMSSATDINNDVFKQGAGAVNADRATAVASGAYGVYMDAGSQTWEPGDYRGTDYGGFAHLVMPGDALTKTFTVVNDSPNPVNVDVSTTYLERISETDLSFTVTPAMVAAESAYGAANRDNFYKAFQYFIPITATPGMSTSMYNVAIPADTDLMIVRQIFPYSSFDPNNDYVYDNRYYLMVYNWTDENGDGSVWKDKNGNGVVNIINGTQNTAVDTGPELLWDDPRNEVDRWEYERFGYNRPTANVNELTVQDPLHRMHDGMFIGLRHLFTSLGATVTTTLQYRIEFYKKADADWLDTDVTNLTVPASGTATFEGEVNVPANIPVGDYSAAVEVYDPGVVGTVNFAANTTVIPVVINVVQPFTNSFTLGGYQAYNHDANTAYNNGAVRGYFDWSWREESGDWRFFYTDIDNACLVLDTQATEVVSQTFDSVTPPALPANWSDMAVSWPSGTEPIWKTAAGTVHPSGQAAHSPPNLVYFNSYSAASTRSARLQYDVDLDLSTSTAADLNFWMYHDTGYTSRADRVIVQVSTDGGTTWSDVGAPINRYDGTTGWAKHTVSLNAYVGMPAVRVGLLGISDYGNDVHIDDVSLTSLRCSQYAFPPDAHVIVKDQWADTAPRTDIDTVVLGPTDSGLADAEFGMWAGDFTDSSYYGPYTLDTVAKSPVVRSGQATWQFNTSSGANEDWVAFPIEDGLHELLQHNVLFEGDKFDVVFTKTVGLLTESVHDFAIDTYVDSGTVGQVALESTIGLNGLTASAYLNGVAETTFPNEPLGFTGAGTIEWTYVFTVTDGTSIEATTTSGNIPDIDLYLYRWTGSTYQQVSSSAGSTASEHVLFLNPPDGRYLIGIDNYSGPAGTFNLDLLVKYRVPGLSVTGATASPIPANTPVTLTINFNYPLQPGVTYDGVVLAGPPEAPQLKQIPVAITRLENSAYIEKKVNHDVAFPGDELRYTIDLFNLSDAAADFQFTDPIPANTVFVTATNATYDALNNRVIYTGSLPLSGFDPIAGQGFEAGVMPPTGWSTEHLGTTTREWDLVDAATYPAYVHSGDYAAWVNYDSSAPSDEWLFSPVETVTSDDNMLEFWALSDTGSPGATMTVYAIEASGAYTDTLWDLIADESWPTFVYRKVSIDLSAYEGESVRIAWRYHGLDGHSFGLDDIHLPGDGFNPVPSKTVELTVMVTDTIASGAMITNTGSLVAKHAMPQGLETEPVVTASAVTRIGGGAAFANSHKDAEAEVTSGDIIHYEVHVVNSGDSLAAVTFTDPIPAGTTFDDYVYNGPYYGYNSSADQMEWAGNIGPHDEMVFEYSVAIDTDPALWNTVITNTATIDWGSGSMDVTATTLVVPPYSMYLPIMRK